MIPATPYHSNILHFAKLNFLDKTLNSLVGEVTLGSERTGTEG